MWSQDVEQDFGVRIWSKMQSLNLIQEEVGCGDRMWSQDEEPECGARMWRQDVEPGCGARMWSQGVEPGCRARVLNEI